MYIKKNTYIAIMAGGVGSRFWPASRENRPKQFLDIMGVGKSLLRLTFERFLKLCPVEQIYILTNAAYKPLVLEQLPELSENQVVCEPSRNNTAPCVAYTAFKLNALNPEANFVVAPSDHIILKEDIFVEKIEQALAFTAKHDALLTLGIAPTRPDTGYGYIKFDNNDNDINTIHKVLEFKEKPNLDTAKLYYTSGNYVWNAGIFIWRTKSILAAFQKHSPEVFNILKTVENQYNTPNEQTLINSVYPTCPNISIDYAIMEKADNVFTIPADFGWSDLGTWASLYAESEKTEGENVLQGKNIRSIDTTGCIVRAPKDKLLILKDLHNYIVVDEGDVLLICPREKEQEVKAIVARVTKEFPTFI